MDNCWVDNMSLPRRRPTSAYRLREHALVATVCRLWRAFAASGKVARAVVSLVIIVLIASTLDGYAAFAQASRRADRAIFERDSMLERERNQTVDLRLTGPRAKIKDLAGDFANSGQ
jgi:hypothetical protein